MCHVGVVSHSILIPLCVATEEAFRDSSGRVGVEVVFLTRGTKIERQRTDAVQLL